MGVACVSSLLSNRSAASYGHWSLITPSVGCIGVGSRQLFARLSTLLLLCNVPKRFQLRFHSDDFHLSARSNRGILPPNKWYGGRKIIKSSVIKNCSLAREHGFQTCHSPDHLGREKMVQAWCTV